MYFLTAIGVTVGLHRHFAHCAFQANQNVRIILAVLGSMAAEGPPQLLGSHPSSSPQT